MPVVPELTSVPLQCGKNLLIYHCIKAAYQLKYHFKKL